MTKIRIYAVILLLLTVALGFFLVRTEKDPTSNWHFRLGLDLKGGTALTYKADVSKIAPSGVKDAMASLKDVIERRVNQFGVSEPVVQVEEAGIAAGAGSADQRLVVELPGISNIQEAVALIGKTPLLEFRLVSDNAQALINSNASSTLTVDQVFLPTGLTGSLLEKAQLEFNQQTAEPIVSITWNAQGRDLFAKLTRENIGKPIAIILDGNVISQPVVREEIKDGKAQISGRFTPAEAKKLVADLNYGSLPVPVELISTQTIGATLGANVLNSGIRAGLYGFLIVALFLVIWYRLPGFFAVVSLVSYVVFMLTLFKLIPVTITAAGIAGFILSMGMAVDANILIFERMKEEIRAGRTLRDGIREGFSRAWLSIRDGNFSGIIASLILFWLGTSLVKGFALTLGVGITVSMFTAIVIARTYLFAIATESSSPLVKFLFGSGITK